MNTNYLQESAYETALALVGMSGRFPGAATVEALWHNIASGISSIRPLSDDELLAAGIDPAQLAAPNYIKAGSVLEGIADFDASFFGYTPREAEVMDPQHRLFLECCWEALERAGYDPGRFAGLAGVFAGSGFNTYMAHHLYPREDLRETVGQLQMDVGNERDSLASTVSYKLDLRGPALGVQTFCSSSLVAVHLAAQSLLNYECDLALAGGVALSLQQPTGYHYEPGGILSPDGLCRALDGKAQGSVMGSGVGVVVLKRLADALDQGDQLYAILRGSAVNNDGRRRVSYTAPGVDGQAAVIAAAQSYAGVSPQSISYVETHGTGTPLGDAVELEAMKKAFGEQQREASCALGSVKPNIGHLDRASGVTGLIKATQALWHRQLPPSLNYESSSRELQLEQSGFWVNTQLQAWPEAAEPRRAGVSSFGLGGTNAHVVLEEAPEREAGTESRDWQLLLLSGRTEQAVEQMGKRLGEHLRQEQGQELADVAYTLQVGRSEFAWRELLLCRNRQEASAQLESTQTRLRACVSLRDRPVTFIFPATTAPLLANGFIKELYATEQTFQEELERCCDLLPAKVKRVVHERLFSSAPTARQENGVTELLTFIVEYALAKLLGVWGIRPAALFGAGTGEYVAACLAGVLTCEDALALICAQLEASSPASKAESLKHALRGIKLNAAQIPYVSQLTGTWITAEQATDVAYFQQLLTLTGQVDENIADLLSRDNVLLLEIGTDQAKLFARTQASDGPEAAQWLSLFASPIQSDSAQAALLATLGQLWLAGITINWEGFYAHERRLRVLLPTYPFERQRYWIDSPQEQANKQNSRSSSQKRADIADWFYLPSWLEQPLQTSPGQASAADWLVFVDESGLGARIAEALSRAGSRVVSVRAGEQFAQLDRLHFVIRASERADYAALLSSISLDGNKLPTHVLHAWSVDQTRAHNTSAFQHLQERAFYSLLYLQQALDTVAQGQPLQIVVLSNLAQSVSGYEEIEPAKVPILGLCKVISQEQMHITCRCIDVELDGDAATLAEQLLPELSALQAERVVAYRQGQRWIQTYQPMRLEAPPAAATRLREHGVYLITGGLGGVGPVLGEYLFSVARARLAFLGRTSLPAREEWHSWLAQHDADNALSQKIRQVQALEAAGAQVLLIQADVADEEQLRSALQEIKTHFGALDGVIHAAAISQSDAFQPVQEISRETCELHFQPKVYGLYALERALQDQPLDFCVLFSSISSVLGGLGFAGYVAANMFMDAFVQRHNQSSSIPWLSINWDTWSLRPEGHGALGGSVNVYAMSRVEGLEVFSRLLACDGLNQVVVSTGDLQTRIQQWVLLDSVRAASETSCELLEHAGQGATIGVASREEYERNLSEIWQQVLGIGQVGLYDNFFELGGNSLSALQVIARIRKVFGVQVPVVTLFDAPTISAMARYLLPQQPAQTEPEDELLQRRSQARQQVGLQDIAIIGMSGRFPGAADLKQFWRNLHDGVESISFFSEEELLAAGVDPDELRMPNYVRARPILPDGMIEEFDASFFGYNPREAELMDPQHRLFLTCCWEAFEHAGYNPYSYQGLVGVYGGANISSYLHSLLKQPELLASLQGVVNEYQAVIGMDKDSLATGVSYKLNLRGPSFSVQTFCSTSLVAVHLAAQSLRTGECDMALAGGASVRIPYKSGHLYEQGGMESADGHCRTFDADAHGTMVGDGAGVVVLKRLADAVRDGDTIHAVLKGSAINNDGSLKVSYSAPSVSGQAGVVSSALENAGINAESIDYIEAHGTATELGDPIEVASLTRAFRKHTERRNYCAIGSVKTNVGHLDRAAGVSGLIKTVLALKHEALPASLHYVKPNPQIDFENSPFYVNTQLTPWRRTDRPRRAGVSSLGMGGTNAHVILEEAPEPTPSSSSRPWQLLPLSAKTASALQTSTERLRVHLQEYEETQLADVAYTLQVGRNQFDHRSFVLARNQAEAIASLESKDPRSVFAQFDTHRERQVAFLFPGVGEQFSSLTQELYQQEPIFREALERCFSYLETHFGLALRNLLYAETAGGQVGHANGKQHAKGLDLRSLLGRNGSVASDPASEPVKRTEIAQPLVFSIEYALAQLLMQWGLKPQALLGYSLGEYVAACLAGVFSLEDALTLVTRRAQAIQRLPAGAMLAVALSEESVAQYVDEGIALAALNAPGTSVLAGPLEDIEWLHEQFTEYGIIARRIETTHAFHTPMLAPARAELMALASSIQLHAPQIPYLSNVTGTWITAEQATDPAYWARHMCETVRFADGAGHLLQETNLVLVEVGPGQSLSSFVKQHPACGSERISLVLPTLPSLHDKQSEQAFLLTTLGKLWLAGVAIDWQGFYTSEQRQRIPLPTYPFEPKRYWLAAPGNAGGTVRSSGTRQGKRADIASWFYQPTWEQTPLAVVSGQEAARNWLIFEESSELGAQLAQELARAGHVVVRVQQAAQFAQLDSNLFTLRPGERADYIALCKALIRSALMPRSIVHCWSITAEQGGAICPSRFQQQQEQGFYSLLFLAQALGELIYEEPVQVLVLSNGMHAVTGQEVIDPEKVCILGACKVIPQEQLNITCRSIDLTLPASGSPAYKRLLGTLIAEGRLDVLDPIVAYRQRQRWVQTYKPVPLASPEKTVFRQQGVYLITGGLGGVGLTLAEHLAQEHQARLVLTSRSALPPRMHWEAWLKDGTLDEGMSRKIERLLQIECLGGEVLVVQADVTDVQQMKGVIRQTFELFGDLHGVIHAAGITADEAFRVVQEIGRAECEAHFQPKVYGLLALEQALQGHDLDFCLLFSSISTVLGGLSYLGYVAANAFMDAYTDRHNQSAETPWVCVNWDTWQTKEHGHGRATTVSDYVMSPTEGLEALQRVLAADMFAHIVTSTGDLHARIKQWIRLEALESADESAQKGIVSGLSNAARPDLATPYVPARDDYEQKIVDMWQHVLGIGQIGIHDNFFELGGHSLIGTQLVSRLRHTFQINLPLVALFEAPTIAELALAIKMIVLEEIDKLEEEEVQRLI